QHGYDAGSGQSTHGVCKAGSDNGDNGGAGSDTFFEGTGSEILNQATYKAGRKIRVSTVATASPSIIANAIGPQNTVGAIGIIPSVAAAAVSRMGRVRWIAAITTASQGWCPAAISVPIWSMRMTELRAIMPTSASTPSIATKPIGFWATSSAATTPMRPRGATLSTSKTRWKLCNWNIRMVKTSTAIAGKTACTDAWALALSSTDPPGTIR